MPVLPLTVRQALLAEQTAEVEIALVTFTHADLVTPIRVSSDATQRLSVDPLRYGTVSRGNEFTFVLMSATVPDDQKDTPPRTSLVLDNVSADLVEIMESFTSPAMAMIELVLASAPDIVVQRYKNLAIVSASGDETSVTLDLSKEPFTSEPFGRKQVKQLFPGLFGIPSA